jgi:hypothetical protein
MQDFNFNSECRKDGSEYENVVIAHEVSNNNSFLVDRNISIVQCGIEMDMILDVPLVDMSGKYIKTLRKYAQAKGGKPGEGKKPGAVRTDNVKKAIADGFLLKSSIPNSWYTVYFSEKPKEGSCSEAMINTAISTGIIDEVCYIGY